MLPMPYNFSAVSCRLCTVLARLITFSTPWQAEYLLMASSKQPRHHPDECSRCSPTAGEDTGPVRFPSLYTGPCRARSVQCPDRAPYAAHSPDICNISNSKQVNAVHIQWQWRNVDSYLCQLIFAAILWVELSAMFATVLALKYATLVGA